MLFIRPTIMRNNLMNLATSTERYNRLRKDQLVKYEDGVNLMWEEDQPLLNPIDSSGREIPPAPAPIEVDAPVQDNQLWFH